MPRVLTSVESSSATEAGECGQAGLRERPDRGFTSAKKSGGELRHEAAAAHCTGQVHA